MVIKGKDGINTEMVYQGEARAVGKTKPSVFKLPEDGLSGGLNIGRYSEDIYTAFCNLIHKRNRCCMAAPHLK